MFKAIFFQASKMLCYSAHIAYKKMHGHKRKSIKYLSPIFNLDIRLLPYSKDVGICTCQVGTYKFHCFASVPRGRNHCLN